MKLYEINQEIAKVLDSIDEETGEITEEQFEQLTELNLQREVKIENTALYIKSLRAEAKAIEDERKKLQDKERAVKNKIISLENYLQVMLSGEKYKSPLNSIYYGTSYSVNVLDEHKIPCEYLIIQAPKIDRRGLLRAMQDGQNPAGVELEEKTFMVLR